MAQPQLVPCWLSRSTGRPGGDMRHYRHLTREERDRIHAMRAQGKGVCEIAGAIGRDKGTVSRELRRNGRSGCYGSATAQRRYEERRRACRPRRRLADPRLMAEVRERISEDRWSPEQVDGRMRLEAGGACVVSFSTIYREIAVGSLDGPDTPGRRGFRQRLRRKGKRGRARKDERRGKIRISHELCERPAEADARARVGDWEVDTVVGPTPPCLVTLVDRRSRFLCGGKAGARTSAAVAEVEFGALRGRPCHTVTPDRGKEFANHAQVGERLGGVRFYFCAPHHPWEKGTNENTNGLIREFFPKGTDFSEVSEEEVQRVFSMINDRPRKVLGFRTAREVYLEETLHLA